MSGNFRVSGDTLNKCVPVVKLKLLSSCCSDFYGCVLWTCLIMQLIVSAWHGVRAEVDSWPSSLYLLAFGCFGRWLVTFKRWIYVVIVLRLFLPSCLVITPPSRPCWGMASTSWEWIFPLLVGMLSSAVMVMVCHYTVFVQCAISLLGQCFMVIWNCQN